MRVPTSVLHHGLPLPAMPVLRYIALVVGLLALGAASRTAAQPQPVRLEPIRMPGAGYASWITSITQDAQGFMWLGTRQGVHRYDGHAFTSFYHDPQDSTSLPGKGGETLYVDRNGTLWVGASRFDPNSGTFTSLHESPDSLGAAWGTALLEDRMGKLWIGTNTGGLIRYDPQTGTFTRFAHDPDDPTSLSHNWVRVLYEDRQGTLWVGTGDPWNSRPEEGGLNRFDPDTESFTRYLHDAQEETSLINNWVQALYEDTRGAFWVGTWEDGLHTMDREKGTFTRHRYHPDDPHRLSRPPLPKKHPLDPEADHAPWRGGVMFIHEDRSGMLWVGGYMCGVYRYDPRTEHLDHFIYDPGAPNTLAGEAVWRLHEANDGTIWIAALDGLTKVTPARGMIAYEQLSISARYPVHALHKGGSVLWLGTAGGLLRMDRRTGETRLYRHDPADPTSLSHDDVTSLLEEPSGMLWVGTREGLNRFDPTSEAFTRYRHDPGSPGSLSHDAVSRLYRDRSGVLWVGTFGGGLNRFDPDTGTFTRFRHDSDEVNSLGGNQVTTILEDRRGALWVGTREDGLSRLDATRRVVTRFPPDRSDPNALTYPYVTSLYEDARETLWVGTFGGGLHRFEAGSFAHVSRENSRFPGNQVLGILDDNHGRLWLTTDQGLVEYNPAENTIKTYGLEHGLPAKPFNLGAHYKSPSGELFWGTQDGFVSVDPARANPYPPRLALTGFQSIDAEGHTAQYGVSGRTPPRVRLAHSERTFTVEVAALHYARPEANRYAYRLDPYDPVWREAGTQRTASYVNVPPGEYTFRVRAANPDGVWSEAGASIRITVLPPWWRTPWAYLLYGLVLLTALFMVDRMQRRRLVQKERARARLREEQLKAAAAEERARILSQLDEAKSRFFANVSHELRTPLTLILGPLEDALRASPRPLEAADLERMRRSARRLRGLINQLLDLSRLEAGRLELHRARHDLVAFLRRLVRSFASLAERRHVTLRFETEREALAASFDAEKLEQVISNLLDNALKFTPEGGRVRLHLHPARGGEAVEIRVRDTGPGIPKAEQQRIFDRFHQLDDAPTRTQEGAGIGLALARELVELHGGTLGVESEPGFGSEFIVRLPLGEPEEAGASPQEPEATPPPADQIDSAGADEGAEQEAPPDAPTVLIVDDNADVRAYLRSRLVEDYQVAEAADGLEGLEQAHALEPDLVIADVMMPRMDGYALCRAIKEDEGLGHVPVVLLTARADEASRLEGLSTGADDYLSKPFSSEELLLRTENLITIRRRLRARYGGSVLLEPAGVEITSEEAAFLEEVKAAIEIHLSESAFTVEWLASEVGVSTRQLQRRLKASTGLSPSGLLRMMRLERAARLLEQQAGTVAEVAYRVGYASADAFSRVFQQIYGTSPSAHPSQDNA